MLLRANQDARITSYFKMDVINSNRLLQLINQICNVSIWVSVFMHSFGRVYY